MIGIYARQSVEKKDSISIAYQIARCKAMYAAEEAYEVFQDQGFSGEIHSARAFKICCRQFKQIGFRVSLSISWIGFPVRFRTSWG